MVISKAAISEFMERTLRDSARVKSLSDDALNDKILAIEPVPTLHTEPRTYQKACYLLGLKYPNYFFSLDMGLGKTKIILDVFAQRKACGECKRGLVLVPGTQHVQGWLDQIAEHRPDVVADGMLGERAQRESALWESGSELFIGTYMGFLSFVCSKKKGENASGLAIDEKKFFEVAKQFDFVIYDEPTCFRSHTSLTFRVLKKFGKYMKFRYALAGMPFGRHPENLWSQFYALDYGETLGELGIFRGAFFKAQRNYFSGFDEWVFDKSKIDELSRVLRHSSIRYDKDECLDLPDKTPVAVTVHFSDETWAYYERLIEELSAAQGNFKLVDNVFGRMRQLVAGYMTVTDPEGARQTVVFKNNPKLESMLEKLDELEGEKLIIYCDYRKSIEIVSEALKKKKVKHVILVGGAKDKPKIIKQFDDPKIQVLLMTQAGSMGLNLQKHCRYLFFFESPVDPIIRSQTIDRIHRLGQTRRVFVYDFIVKGSVDVKIQKYIAEGKNLFDSLMGNRSAGPTVDG